MPVEEQAMDKKTYSKPPLAVGNCNPEPKSKQTAEYNAGPRNGRGRRAPTVGGAPARRPQPPRQDRRPRERPPARQAAQYGHREQVAASLEGGSVYNRGSKKGFRDASYLVNFRCESARDRHAERYSSSQWQLQRAANQHERLHWHPPPSRIFRPRHVKEQYLQAKCQFVVRDDGAYADNLSHPDRLVDWSFVEQVWLHEDDVEPTTCPICLYPPVAARITRCGHTYCAACLLHYLALSDHASRRCPICEETVYPDQVRRCKLLRRVPARQGDTMTFRLMRRRPESLLGQPADADHVWEELITLSDAEEKQRLSKLVLASPDQVASMILAPERAELEQQLSELKDEPEACFVEQALTELAEHEMAVGERAAAAVQKPRRPDPDTMEQQSTPLPTVPADDAIVYECAFDNQTVEEAVETEELSEQQEGDSSDQTTPEEGVGGGARCRSVSEASNSDVTAADLEVAEVQQQTASVGSRRVQHEQPLYYYQAEGGAPVFLHSLNSRMLLAEYGGWEHCPSLITVELIDVDSVTMTAAFRQRLRSLRHLPLTSQLQVVEARLRPPLVSDQTIAQFKDQIKKREQRRRDKIRRERQRLRQEQRHHQYQQQRRQQRADAEYSTAFPAEREEPPSNLQLDLPVLAADDASSTSPEWSEATSATTPSGPSFAELLRAGGGGVGGGGETRRAWVTTPVRPAAPAPTPVTDVRLDVEGGPAPSFSDSWSADLAAALEKVDQDSAAAAGTEAEAKRKGRKGKKGKRVVISGGLNF